MINHLYIKNFKSLKETNLEIRNLNLLTGLNGSGKSSLLQSLLLLRQSNNLSEGKLALQKKEQELFDAGVAEDVYYQFGVEKEIIFQFDFADATPLSWHFDCDIYANPEANILTAKEQYEDSLLIQSAIFNPNFHYLNAQRLSPKNVYRRNVEIVENQRSMGVFGEYAAHFLEVFGEEILIENEKLQHPKAKSEKLIHQVDAWLSEISPNVTLKTEKISNEETRLSYQFGTIERGRTNRFKPKNVGFGLSYVLPVVVSLLAAQKGDLILIENPESHIHPRGQSELGKLLAASAESGAQLFIETHSDHILNGIRIATREQFIQPQNVVAHYFKRNAEDNSSNITAIFIDSKGKLHTQDEAGKSAKIPKGFFDEWTNSMAKLF